MLCCNFIFSKDDVKKKRERTYSSASISSIFLPTDASGRLAISNPEIFKGFMAHICIHMPRLGA